MTAAIPRAPSPQLFMMSNRVKRAALVAISCGIVVLASKWLSLPETALSAYLVLFVSKEDRAETALTSVALCIGGTLALGFAIVVLMATGGAPALRIGAMFGIAFVAMYAARVTSLGVIAATLGMVIFEVLSILDFVPLPDLVLRGIFWLWPVLLLPMAVVCVTSLLFAQGVVAKLTKLGAKRDRLLARAEQGDDVADAVRCELLTGDEAFLKLHRIAKITGVNSAKVAQEILTRRDLTTRLLLETLSGQSQKSERIGGQEHNLARAVENNNLTKVADNSTQEGLRFAIKATLSIAICYGIFLLLNWPAIHTITITAFLVSLGSTAETFHKATLRLAGCLVGSVIAGICLWTIIPNLTSATELAILSTITIFPAAYIAFGPEKAAYFGMQIALVFLLVVVNSSGPSVDFGIAWGRIVGIILGNIVVAVVFLSLWKETNTDRLAVLLRRGEAAVQKANYLGTKEGAGLAWGEAFDALSKARQALEIARLDPFEKVSLTALDERATLLSNSMLFQSSPVKTHRNFATSKGL